MAHEEEVRTRVKEMNEERMLTPCDEMSHEDKQPSWPSASAPGEATDLSMSKERNTEER